MVYISEKVFFLGGCCYENKNWKNVAIFENQNWKTHNELKQSRINFMTIQYGTDVMLIGGIAQDE